MPVTDPIDTLAAFLEERLDWLKVGLVDASAFGKDTGKDTGKEVVIRIDGTYFDGWEEGMPEYFAQRLGALISHAQSHAAAKIRQQRAQMKAGATKNADAPIPSAQRSTYPAW